MSENAPESPSYATADRPEPLSEGADTREAESMASLIDELPTTAIRVNCCETWFTGSLASHCAACHLTFTSPSAFDRHRRGGECIEPATLGMVPADRKWAGWSLPGTYTPEDAA